MSELNLHTLTKMIRSFDNALTAKWIADRLRVSYSTIARAKDGSWPPSVAPATVRSLFDECRDTVFSGDSEALLASARLFLHENDVPTVLSGTDLSAASYDEFVQCVIVQARKASERAAGGVAGGLAAKAGYKRAAERGAGAHGSVPQSLAAIVVALVLAVGLLNVSLGSIVVWALDNFAFFSAGLIAIALLDPLAGLAFDSPLAWAAYRRRRPATRFSPQDFRTVAKFGDPERVVAGGGRFDASVRHCAFQSACNVLGALCTISLLSLLMELPSFPQFFVSHEWTEFFKVGIVVGCFVAYSHNHALATLPPCTSVSDDRENPDNYTARRLHVWANALHLVCTFSLVCIFVLGLLAYSFAHFREGEAPLGIIWPYLQTMLFLGYSSVSKTAKSAESLGIGAFLPGALASSLGVCALVAICYQPTWRGGFVIALCLACLAASLLLGGRATKHASASWIERGKKSRSYSIIVIVSVFAMLAIGISTAQLV